jgi:hypothetical protein
MFALDGFMPGRGGPDSLLCDTVLRLTRLFYLRMIGFGRPRSRGGRILLFIVNIFVLDQRG